MIVTDVHSDHCVSGIVLSAYSVESLHAGGTLPLTSLTYSESDANHHTWRWMPVQSAGGGFAARLDNLEDRIRHLDDMEDGIRRLGESIGSIAVAKAPEHVAEIRKAEKPKIKFYPGGIDQALNDRTASKAGSEPMKNPHA